MAEDSFFSRWSRRKADARPAPAPVTVVASPSVEPVAHPPATPAHPEPSPTDPSLPTPTLADVAQLTPEADFSRFVARNVVPQVRNAAMKKLFADPHFNVMDGLDIYIDDYSIPSPLEPELVADMLASPFFNPPKPVEPPDAAAPSVVGSCAEPAIASEPLAQPQNDATVESAPPALEPEPVVCSAVASPISPSSPPLPHDHADLQLQPDPAAGPEGTGPGAG